MLFLLAFLSQAYAQTVMIQAPRANELDYRAALKAHPGYLSPSRFYRDRHPLAGQREQLITTFADAQRAFLGESLPEARKKLLAVLDLLWSDEWERSDREIFLAAYLRLAQIESQPEARDQWLSQSLLLGEDAHYDSTLYPPPLHERREELSKDLRLAPGRALPPGWTDLLVNGRSCARQNCRLPASGKVRATLVSEQWLPQSRIVDVSELEDLRPQAVALVQGHCGEEKFHPESDEMPARKAFWSPVCDNPRGPDLGVKTRPDDPIPTLFTGVAPAKKFYQSEWFWTGVGAAAIATAVIIHNSHREETRDTSTTYGY
jgi:hypothetical protein